MSDRANAARPQQRRSALLWAAFAAVLLVATLAIWMRWLAPTRIALVNYPDFQAARILKAGDSMFISARSLGVDELDRLDNYDLVLIFGRGLRLDDAQRERLRSAARRGARIYVDGATNPQDDLTSVRGADIDAIEGYLRNGGSANYRNLFAYARAALDRKWLAAPAAAPPLPMPQDVFFHLDEEAVFGDFAAFDAWLRARPDWQPGRPRLALLTSVPGPFNSNRDHVDAVIRAFEAAGFEVVPVAAARKRLEFLRQIEPAAVVYLPHGRLTVGEADQARAWLAQRDIPLFAPLAIFAEQDAWLADQRGLDGALLSMSVALPELDGAVAPMAFAAQLRDSEGLKVFRALPQRLDRFVALVKKTVELKHKSNADKKVAIYYYKGPGQSALTAGDLEVMPSLYALLRHMAAAGYRVEGLPGTEAAFAQLLQRRGPNIGPYARGDFAAFLSNAEPALVPARQLDQWCGTLIDGTLCEDVRRAFGAAPGDYLSTGDQVAVARVPLGNVVLLPQPLPGIGEDTFKLVHGTRLAPPWPYVASYLWARAVFGADMIVHFGTHGSLEFTPWKQVGLSSLDWPDALLGDTPHRYLYTMSNVGEAIIAKRRSYATIVSHLTPPFRDAGAQSAHKLLADRLQSWDAASSPTLRSEYAREVQKRAVELNLHLDLGLPRDATWDDGQLQRLANHMEAVEHARITAGLYTLGTPYAIADLGSSSRLMGLDALVQALLDLDVARGQTTAKQAESSAWVARVYRPRADRLIEDVSGGQPPAKVLARVVSDAELQRAQAWEAAQRRPGEDELVRSLLGGAAASAGRPGKRPDTAALAHAASSDVELRAHLARALADPGKREFLEELRSEQRFKQVSRVLDPEALEKARTMARAIPAIARSIEISSDADVRALLVAMQTDTVRTKVLAWIDDPSLQSQVAEEAQRARKALAAEADKHLAALETAAAPDAESRVAALDAVALQSLQASLRFWQQAPALSAELQQRREGARAGLARLQAAVDRQRERRASDERHFAQAVLVLRDRLAAIPQYADALQASPPAELAAMSKALAGGFTEPSVGGDPLVSPAALPTGRNLYSIDAEKTPSDQAWRIGKSLVDEMLAQHRAANGGAWPQKVAFTLWAGDFIHTEGTGIAQIFYLLGVELVRDPFGRVISLRLIPRETLGRPRIDVVVQTSGQLRDLAASRLYLINRAVAMAAAANETDNAVASGARAMERQLKEAGAAPADAQRLAAVRVFGGVNGNYGTAIMGLVEAGDRWTTDAEVASTYIANMGAVYGEGDLWGAFQKGAFEAALAGTEVVVQPLESNTWGPISLDHVYEFMGGLNLAVREVTGRDPAAYFSDYRSPSRPAVREAGAAIAVEARSTLLNPNYVQALAQGGASSAETFAETFRNLYGWNVMKPAVIRGELWDELYTAYVDGPQAAQLRPFFEQVNPYALQEISAVMLEVARKGYWKPGDARLDTLARLHADLVGRHGSSGTEFVNDNRALSTYIAARLDGPARSAYEQALQKTNQGVAAGQANVVLRRDDAVSAATAESGKAAVQDIARRASAKQADQTGEREVSGTAAASAALSAGLLLIIVSAIVLRMRRRHVGRAPRA